VDQKRQDMLRGATCTMFAKFAEHNDLWSRGAHGSAAAR
jgi:hypothetical protein